MSFSSTSKKALVVYTKLLANFSYLRTRGFFDLLSVNFLTQFLSFGSILLVAKFLTPVELGEVKIIQSYIGLFAILAGFGFNAAVLKTCAENRSDQEKDGILRLAVGRASITTSIVLAMVIILASAGVITQSRSLSAGLIVYSWVIPLQVLTSIFIVFLQAQKKIKEMARAQAIVKLQSVPIIVFSTWLWGFYGFILATIAAFALGLWPFLRQIGLKFLRTPLEKKPAHFMSLAFFSVFANGVNQLGQRGDILILDRYSTNREAIGFYALALIFVMAASQVTGTVQSITTPYFTEKALDESWFRRQLITNQLRLTLLSVVVAIGIFIGAWLVVPWFYGQEYAPTLAFLAVLLIKYCIWSSYALIGVAIFSLGFVRVNTLSVMISTPISLVATYVLLTEFGIMGVAWAQVLSALLSLCLNVFFLSIVLRKAYR